MSFLSPLVQRHQTIKSTFARLIISYYISFYFFFFYIHTYRRGRWSCLMHSCASRPLTFSKTMQHVTEQEILFYIYIWLNISHNASLETACIKLAWAHLSSCSRRNKSIPLTTGHDTEKNFSHNWDGWSLNPLCVCMCVCVFVFFLITLITVDWNWPDLVWRCLSAERFRGK